MKTDSKRRLRSARKGKILVLLAICLPALVGMTTLVLDVGVFFACARTVQSMADSTATAAAKEAQLGKTNAEISAACADLVQDDVTLKNTSFTIHRPPTTGAYAGSDKHVEVEVRGDASTFFLHWLGGGNSCVVTGRSVAGCEISTADAAIVVLDPNPPPFTVGPLPTLPVLPALPAIVGGLEILGVGQVRVDGAVLSNNEWGGKDEHGDQVGVPSGPLGLSHSVSSLPLVSLSKLSCRDLRVSGGVDRVENYAPYVAGQPAPLAAGKLPVPDPLRSLPAPTISADSTNVKATNFGGKDVVLLSDILTPLKPGVYEWINVTLGPVKFEPGVYIIRGRHPVTQLSLNLSTGKIDAQGVMFYITDNAAYSPTSGAPDSLDLETSPPNVSVADLLPAAVINAGILGSKFSGISDPNSPFRGMLVYQRRHDRRPLIFVQENVIGPGVVQGTVYSKWGHVVLAGKGNFDARLVAGTMRVVALLDVQIQPPELLAPAEDVYLVE